MESSRKLMCVASIGLFAIMVVSIAGLASRRDDSSVTFDDWEFPYALRSIIGSQFEDWLADDDGSADRVKPWEVDITTVDAEWLRPIDFGDKYFRVKSLNYDHYSHKVLSICLVHELSVEVEMKAREMFKSLSARLDGEFKRPMYYSVSRGGNIIDRMVWSSGDGSVINAFLICKDNGYSLELSWSRPDR